MCTENRLVNNVGRAGLSLSLKFTTTKPVNLDYLSTIEGVTMFVGKGGCRIYDVPVDNLAPERPCNTTLIVTTHTNEKGQGVSQTDIEVDPNNFYYREDPIVFLCRILKIKPVSLEVSEVRISTGGRSSTVSLPDLEDSLFDFPNGFLLEKST